jgi:hypothetical protein
VNESNRMSRKGHKQTARGARIAKYWAEHPDELAARSAKTGASIHKWAIEHPDEVTTRGAKISRYWAEHPEELTTRIIKYSVWCAENPDEVAARGAKYSEWATTHPNAVATRNANRAKWAVEHPEEVAVQGAKHSKWFASHPDEVAMRDNKVRKSLREWWAHLKIENPEEFAARTTKWATAGRKAAAGHVLKNKLEQRVEKFILAIDPSFAYVGDSALHIETKNPDFISEKKHKIIEVDGHYWHNRSGAKAHDRAKDKIYAENGYTVLHIGENEFNKFPTRTLHKIENFLQVIGERK